MLLCPLHVYLLGWYGDAAAVALPYHVWLDGCLLLVLGVDGLLDSDPVGGLPWQAAVVDGVLGRRTTGAVAEAGVALSLTELAPV